MGAILGRDRSLCVCVCVHVCERIGVTSSRREKIPYFILLLTKYFAFVLLLTIKKYLDTNNKQSRATLWTPGHPIPSSLPSFLSLLLSLPPSLPPTHWRRPFLSGSTRRVSLHPQIGTSAVGCCSASSTARYGHAHLPVCVCGMTG